MGSGPGATSPAGISPRDTTDMMRASPGGAAEQARFGTLNRAQLSSANRAARRDRRRLRRSQPPKSRRKAPPRLDIVPFLLYISQMRKSFGKVPLRGTAVRPLPPGASFTQSELTAIQGESHHGEDRMGKTGLRIHARQEQHPFPLRQRRVG